MLPLPCTLQESIREPGSIDQNRSIYDKITHFNVVHFFWMLKPLREYMLYGNNFSRLNSDTGLSDGFSVVVIILQLAGC